MGLEIYQSKKQKKSEKGRLIEVLSRVMRSVDQKMILVTVTRYIWKR